MEWSEQKIDKSNIDEFTLFLKEKFKNLNESKFTLDLEGVERVDFTFVQLFVALRKSCNQKGVELEVVRMEESVRRYLEFAIDAMVKDGR